mgnify:CR=1 FL=1|jgi:hypothetical protein
MIDFVLRSLIGVLLAQAMPSVVLAAQPIYRCVEAETVIYSDRPCSAHASTFEADAARITVLEVMQPEASPSASAVPRRPAARDSNDGQARAKHAAMCAKLEQALRNIRSTMRQGYGAKKGTRLNERYRKLAARRRELRC